MNNSMDKETLKMRFKLPNGEEFEAQGPQEFIEAQRNYFLALIGQQTLTAPSSRLPNTPSQSDRPVPHFFAAANSRAAQVSPWERLFRVQEHTLVLRRKAKISPQDTAILILAAARDIFKQSAYSALELSRSLKALGIEGGRLDRLLVGEIQAGRMTAQGSKRGRTYQLSNEGLAHAFVLAHKLLGE
ncbi:MAG: hypothetical protein J6Y25_01545 [Elusimicrobiaceae bacterium]|nr:hypothetical protein [Elusimicrobiaceae bacterium]MBP5616989.1 hypothetical protein [Elusimicrobiaceae bacterium]